MTGVRTIFSNFEGIDSKAYLRYLPYDLAAKLLLIMNTLFPTLGYRVGFLHGCWETSLSRYPTHPRLFSAS